MNWAQKLKQFLHDPIDKCLDIKTHEQRATEYAEILGVSGLDEAKGSDWISSCMERSLLPKGIKEGLNEIRHPLSDSKIDVPEIDIEETKKIVTESFNELANKVKDKEDKIKFLSIWRNLLEVIEEKSKQTPCGKFFSVIPADTRIPDHSIWEHIKIASAVNAFQQIQNNSLFLFTIGPVQSFISQARKAQDLFMGSFLLSYLTFIAIERLIEDYGPTAIIYPDLYSQPLMDWYLENKAGINVENSFANFVSYPTIPNRFVAIIHETEEAKIKDFAKGLENIVMTEWRNLVNKVLKAFEIKLKEDKLRRQISDFPQIYWTAIPWKIGEADVKLENFNDFIDARETNRWNALWDFAMKNGEYSPNIGFLYQLLYTSLEKSIRVRKNLRDFTKTVEEGKKCHLCGEKEALIKADHGNLNIGKFIGDPEGLCVVCFTKRGLEKYLKTEFSGAFGDFSFPSTAEVALTDFKEKALEKLEFEEYIEAFKNVVGKKFNELIVNPLPKIKEKFKNIENLDGEWFFKENLTEKMFKKQFNTEASEAQIKELKDKLKTFTDKVGEEPNPYYAVIMLDADNMGKWLSGENLPKIENAYNSEVWERLDARFKEELSKLSPRKFLTPAIHSAISSALKNYSIIFVPKIVEEEHLGKLVYAGGDDVLAFVNLRDMFDVMQKLRAAFSGNIKFKNGTIKVDWTKETGFVEEDGRFLLTMGKDATASMGVVIAHYKMPLRIVLTRVKKMENLAKSNFGKDSFAVALLKHSGEERIGMSKWRYENLDVLEFLKELADAMEPSKKPHLSDKFIYSLDKEFLRLKNEKDHFTGTGEIFNTELKRLINRSYEEKNKEKKKSFVDDKCEKLTKLFWDSGGKLDNFLSLLEVASFMNRRRI